MSQYLKRIERIVSIFVLLSGLTIPLLIFLNRFLIPDISADSLNYHYYLGFKGWNSSINKFEFFPTGIHNFSPVLDMVGYSFSLVLGYRLGSIFSVISIYLSIFGLYKIYKLLLPKNKITNDIGSSFLFVSLFISFELYLGIASYYVDGLVAMLTVWCLYYLLKFFDSRRKWNLFISAFILSFLILGKQTNLSLAISYFLSLIIFLLYKKASLKLLMPTIIIVASLPLFWYLNNYVVTGNPVFPFYNAIFKSKYFEISNFIETQFGGRNLWERILWFWYSLFDPKRLGQVHDLFNDFKLNLSISIVLIFVLLKRVKGLTCWLVLFFCFSYLAWSLQFGYLRYGLILEYIGGLLILIFYSQIKNNYRYLIFLLLFLWLIVINKRIINLSLAYDIGFRQSYFYNRESYPKELINWNVNVIKINQNVADFNPDIYLNCAMGGMTYYPLSPFNMLPVINIDNKSYLPMTGNLNYNVEIYNRLKPYLDNRKIIKFVTIAAVTGMNTESTRCIETIKSKQWQIDGVYRTNFLNYDWQGLNVIYGQIEREYFDNIK